jgi:hypothetical protein
MTSLIEKILDEAREDTYLTMQYNMWALWGYLASFGTNQLPSTLIKGLVGDEILMMNSH